MAAVKVRPSLTLVRTFKAPPEKVWRALTQPDAIKQWLGPGEDFKMPAATIDLKVGGCYAFEMRTPDGTEHHGTGVYREIVPNRRLVFTWSWSWTAERESLVTFELRPAVGGTELTLRHEQFVDDEERDKHQHGWQGSLERLDHLVA